MVIDKVHAYPADNKSDPKEISISHEFTKLGKGEFGIVFEATLTETDEAVVIKATNITQTQFSEVEFLRESRHCNIVKLLYVFYDHEYEDRIEYMIMERMETSLWKLYNRGEDFPMFVIKLYMYQLLRSLAFLHSLGICHRDVKPENILIDTRTGVLKLCDFGLAEKLSLYEGNTPDTCTLYYRAPEMLLNYRNYTEVVDVWSAGCVMLELLRGGTALFSIAEKPITQLLEVVNYFGTPTEDQFVGMEPKFPFYSLPEREAKPLTELILPHSVSVDAIALCSRLLRYRPSSRLRPNRALCYKFFDELRSPEKRFLDNGNPLPPLFNFTTSETTLDHDHLIPNYLKENDGGTGDEDVNSATFDSQCKPESKHQCIDSDE